eukprot:TRINITY_DN2795_c0_g1_i1.p1 TRINITY_DN2795_c0_g1~~TRINITY_DN2795_c0_g1_i1.p1  ORF type:complete len:629 (+),score=40.50 TRINITY_DN2795_c0_g1_i1:814-2700(+)
MRAARVVLSGGAPAQRTAASIGLPLVVVLIGCAVLAVGARLTILQEAGTAIVPTILPSLLVILGRGVAALALITLAAALSNTPAFLWLRPIAVFLILASIVLVLYNAGDGSQKLSSVVVSEVPSATTENATMSEASDKGLTPVPASGGGLRASNDTEGESASKASVETVAADPILTDKGADTEVESSSTPPSSSDTSVSGEKSSDPQVAEKMKSDRPPNLAYEEGMKAWRTFSAERQCSLDDSEYAKIFHDLQSFHDRHAQDVENGTKKAEDPIITQAMQDGAKGLPRCDHHAIRSQRLVQGRAYAPLINEFAHLLPDMDFVFNELDEPRVLYNDLSSRQPLDIRGFRRSEHNKLYERESNPDMASLLDVACKTSHREYYDLYGLYVSPASFSASYELIPIFSGASIRNCFADIILPTYYFFSGDERYDLITKPWNEKEDNLYWRGSSTGCLYNGEVKWQHCHRIRLARKFGRPSPEKNQGTDFDVGMTDIIQLDGWDIVQVIEQYIGRVVGRESFQRAGDFKYVLDIDGNSFSRRFPQYLQSLGSLIFRVHLTEDWAMDRARAWEHYVPVNMSFVDLRKKVDWARQNDATAQDIVRKGREFADAKLRVQDMTCYVFRLLLEYYKLIS